MKRATVGPLPGVTQDIAGFKVLLFHINTSIVIGLHRVLICYPYISYLLFLIIALHF